MDPVKRKLKIYNNYNYNTNYILVFHFATGTLKMGVVNRWSLHKLITFFM